MIAADIIGERSRLSPEKTALVEVATGRRLTYREMNERAVAAAKAWIHGLDLSPGERVGILSGNRLEFVDAFAAAGKCGVILVPLGTRLTASELAEIVADCGLSALLYDEEHRGTVDELRRLVAVGELVALDGDDMDGGFSWQALLASTASASAPFAPCRPEDPYCLLYTSGTTGRPKGVITPHRQIAWNAYNTVVCWQLSEADVSPIFTPLYHAGGLGAFLTPILLAGGTIVLHRDFDPAEIWRSVEEERCTVVLGVPTIWKLLADDPGFDRVDLSDVRWFISGGAPLPRHFVGVFRDRGIVMRQGYGLTEVGVNCFAMSDEEAWLKAGSIGRPLMFTEARVVGPDGLELGADDVGELCFRGPHVSAGYWDNPGATAQAIDDQGWFHTGDMARVDSDGSYTIAGRAKDMFISGGVNIYPAEIENVMLQHPDLLDAAVVGVAHETWGEVGVAFLVEAPGKKVSGDELAEFLAGRIARFKVPRQYEIVAELPRTAYGKVVKAELVGLAEKLKESKPSSTCDDEHTTEEE